MNQAASPLAPPATTSAAFSITDRTSAAAQAARLQARRGELDGPTSGLVPGAVQGNIAIMPTEYADDFLRFCHLNQKPCPLLSVSRPGEVSLPELGQDIDIRTDLPRYRVFRDGELVGEPTDVSEWWRDDLVTFVLGCSFSFEEALLDAGVPLRHLTLGRDVAMYRTSVPTNACGIYSGPMVVSMRPFSTPDAIRAIQITSRFPKVHGAPVHFGNPAAIGIDDLDKPDWGESVPVGDGDVPVFWACGVTPQAVIEQARLPFCITHKPSHMLITDRLNTEYAAL